MVKFTNMIYSFLLQKAINFSIKVHELDEKQKRKGKDVVVEQPVHKRTRAEREAERAEMVAKAAEEQASGRARSLRIREQPSRGRGRVGRATRATAQQTERDSSEGEPSAESEGQSSPTLRRSGRTR